MPIAMGTYNRACGGSHCRAAPASDRTTDDSTANGATSCGALCHRVCYGQGECQREQKDQD